jgi:hypothetical protein
MGEEFALHLADISLEEFPLFSPPNESSHLVPAELNLSTLARENS